MNTTVNKIVKNNKLKPITVISKPKAQWRDNDSDENYDSPDELLSNMDDASSYNIEFTNPESKTDNLRVTFEIADLPYCCGISEIGELWISTRESSITRLTELLDKIVKLYSGRTLIINTNGEDSSTSYEKALALCKNWTLVKTFKSANSGNTIKMWVSNNA